MTEVPLADRTRLLSDNGSGYVFRAFGDYLHLVGIRHILATPFHPQTNGKLERYHQSISGTLTRSLRGTIRSRGSHSSLCPYYSYSRYHMALGNVTPADVLNGRRERILLRRKEVQAETIQRRKHDNRTLRELAWSYS